jgi:hypothetical protein
VISLGIMGGIGHGKTSFAEALQSTEPKSIFLESSVLISEIINAWQAETALPPDASDLNAVNAWIALLPGILRASLNVEVASNLTVVTERDIAKNPEIYQKLFDYLESVKKNPHLMRTAITADNKTDYRSVLQWLGNFVQHRLSPGSWFQELTIRARDAEHEGYRLAIYSGVRYPADASVLRASGAFIVEIVRPSAVEIDADDPTEQARSLIIPDCKIINNAKLQDLAACASVLYGDASNGTISQTYIASDLASRSATIRQIKS